MCISNARGIWSEQYTHANKKPAVVEAADLFGVYTVFLTRAP